MEELTNTAKQSALLVERGDIDALTEHVDSLVLDQSWDEMLRLRDRCNKALERGKQLWPVSSYLEYRLALNAPGPQAAAVITEGAGRFALGPLAEVAASTHTWQELRDHLHPSPLGAVTAHERVLRGEDLSTDNAATALPDIFEIPLILHDWEPAYALATYHPDKLEADPPLLLTRSALPKTPYRGAEPVTEETGASSLLELTSTWTTQSNGRSESVAVRGNALEALGALGLGGVARVRVAEISAQTAIALMAWAAASGGAHGRRRGAAAGRHSAWWALASLAGIEEEWPLRADELGEIAEAFRWYAWDSGEPEIGWSLKIAMEDPDDGLAWALSAHDAV